MRPEVDLQGWLDWSSSVYTTRPHKLKLRLVGLASSRRKGRFESGSSDGFFCRRGELALGRVCAEPPILLPAFIQDTGGNPALAIQRMLYFEHSIETDWLRYPMNLHSRG